MSADTLWKHVVFLEPVGDQAMLAAFAQLLGLRVEQLEIFDDYGDIVAMRPTSQVLLVRFAVDGSQAVNVAVHAAAHPNNPSAETYPVDHPGIVPRAFFHALSDLLNVPLATDDPESDIPLADMLYVPGQAPELVYIDEPFTFADIYWIRPPHHRGG